jgi:hypothetical protein
MDLRCRHKNHPDVFGGSPYEVADAGDARDREVLEALRQFVESQGGPPTQESWTAAGFSPSERTVRRRFGSFQAAVAAAGLELGSSEEAN